MTTHRTIDVHIHIDGPRSISREVPEDWNDWTPNQRCAFTDEMKRELLGDSVALSISTETCDHKTEEECEEKGCVTIPYPIAGTSLPCHMTKPHPNR